MASTTKPARKKFRVAVSGPTIDGREISRDDIFTMAETYDPSVYGAVVDIEHYLSMSPDSTFSAVGHVTSVTAEDITSGPLEGRAGLYAEIEPSPRMKQMLDEGKKTYTSIVIDPNFAASGKPYLRGLAMTDTPASLGTERLKFTAKQYQSIQQFNQQSGGDALFTEAIEAEVIELASQRSEEGVNWFNRMMGILNKGQKTDDQRFTQLHQVVEAVAQSQADQIDRFSALEQERQQDKTTIQQLTSELDALRGQLQLQPAENYSTRPAATGNSSAQLADF
ncbi:GPO family capsid scaffolding protein [Klebsiella grimontii]|uniref:GPO family capsid scaffolding protein n=1 Tax=Klebsiella grimontii TaxID=2058152 RepID=UPI001CCAEAA2|nr:GPO family capsid scaffolding protein [Klebsiella grimontii]MBZ7401845.1 GPO family capsid scaffolding protein [Klebsiella grimontii]